MPGSRKRRVCIVFKQLIFDCNWQCHCCKGVTQKIINLEWTCIYYILSHFPFRWYLLGTNNQPFFMALKITLNV